MGKQKLNPDAEPKRAAEAPPMQYVALFGLNYGVTADNPEGTRVEAGEDVPAEVVQVSPWLLEHGHVTVKKGAVNG